MHGHQNIKKERINWREKLLCSKWLSMNEDSAYKIMLNCTNEQETVALDYGTRQYFKCNYIRTGKQGLKEAAIIGEYLGIE